MSVSCRKSDLLAAALGFRRKILVDAVAMAGPRGRGLEVRWAQVWADLLGNDFERAANDAATLENDASAARDAAMVIDAASQRALAALLADDLEQARIIARRASRMARTEALPTQELLAHLVLARVRRLTGHPHLATRILTALARAAGADFRPWLHWELVMSGALEVALPGGPRGGLDDPAERSARLLSELVLAIEAGDEPRSRALSSDLQRIVPWSLLAGDLAVLTSVCDLTARLNVGPVAEWAYGRIAEGPPALHGILTRRGGAPADETAVAYVLVGPNSAARRLPSVAYLLAKGRAERVLPQGRRKQGRVETLVSALAFAGYEGLEEGRAFAEIYGFEYEVELHRNVLHVLLHRAREYLGDAGGIVARHGRVYLELDHSILVPDPRCVKPMQDRLLRAVAEQRGATAKDIATAVGVSLRVAQTALQELAADGACLAERDGRNLRYVVEDTTFSEPTRV